MATGQTPKGKSIDGLSHPAPKRQENFFADLDQAKNKFSGFWLVSIIILVVVFLGLIIAAVNLKRQNISIDDSGNSADVNLSFSDRLSSIKSVGASMLSFNEQEFAVASGADSSDFPLRECKFTFTKDQIVLTGKIRDSWIPVSVKLKIDAVAAGDKFLFVVAPNDLENIVVYGQNKDKIEQSFDKNINQVLKENNMIAQSVSISDDRLELSVVKELP